MSFNENHSQGVSMAKIAKAGKVCYASGCEQKLTSEFEKIIKAYDSIPIIEGTSHHPFTLDQVIGKVSGLKVNGEWMDAENIDWYLDKVKDPKVKEYIQTHQAIPGSVSDLVKLSPVGEHIDQTPLHFLVHPDLKPNIPGAMVKGNCSLEYSQFKKPKEAITMSVKELELAKELEQLKKENIEKAKEASDLLEANNQYQAKERLELTKKLVSSKAYKEEDLKERSNSELSLMVEVQEKLASDVKVKENTAIALGNDNRGNAKAGNKYFKGLKAVRMNILKDPKFRGRPSELHLMGTEWFD